MHNRGVEAEAIMVALRTLLPGSSALRPRSREALCNLGASLILDLYDSILGDVTQEHRNDQPTSPAETPAASEHPAGTSAASFAVCKDRARHPNKWPEDQELYLRAHYRSKPLKDIARDIGRSHSATKTKARSLGLTTSSQRTWSASDLASLRKKYEAGERVVHIAEHLNRSATAVRHRVGLLGIHREVDHPDLPVHGERWTEAEFDYLRQHTADSLIDVASALGRSVKAVSQQYFHCGIKRRKESTAELADRAAKIVKLRMSGVGVSQIAERMGMTVSAVGNICYRHVKKRRP